MNIEYVAPTPRKKMTKQRAAAIFLDKKGICFICRTQIRAHVDKWFIEHPEAVNLGGSDDDKDLWPAHTRCKPGKDAEDAGKIAERNTAITKNFTGKKVKGKSFPKRQDPWGREYRARQSS